MSGFTDLTVTVAFGVNGQTNTTYETDDFIRVQAAFDGDSGGTGGSANPTLTNGTYTTVGQFLGTNINSTSDFMGLDVDLNGTLSGAETNRLTTSQLVDYTFNISGTNGLALTGNTLSLQVAYGIDGGNEELIFDNIRIEGTPAAVPEPSSLMLLGFGGLCMFACRRRGGRRDK